MFPVELSAAASEIIFPLSALEHYKEDFAMLTRCFFRALGMGCVCTQTAYCVNYHSCSIHDCIDLSAILCTQLQLLSSSGPILTPH